MVWKTLRYAFIPGLWFWVYRADDILVMISEELCNVLGAVPHGGSVFRRHSYTLHILETFFCGAKFFKNALSYDRQTFVLRKFNMICGQI